MLQYDALSTALNIIVWALSVFSAGALLFYAGKKPGAKLVRKLYRALSLPCGSVWDQFREFFADLHGTWILPKLFFTLHLSLTLFLYSYLQGRWIVFGFEDSATLEKMWGLMEMMLRADLIVLFFIHAKEEK